MGRAAFVAATTVTALLAATASAGAATLGTGGASSSTTPTRVGTAPHIPNGAVRTSTPSGSTAVDLSVGLEPRDPQALNSFIAAVSTKGSPQYHHYLAKGQFAAAFGPTAATIAKVTDSLRAAGLKPGKVSADGLSIPVSTTLADAARAFGTDFAGYRLKDGSTGFSNSTAPQFAANVSGYVSGVVGLQSLTKRHSMHTALRSASAGTTGTNGRSAATGTRGSAVTPAVTGPAICAAAKTALTNKYGVSDGSDYFSAGPLSSAYGMEHTSTSGAGVTVGVLEMENFSDSDLARYQSCYGTHVKVTRVKSDGGPTEAPNPAKNIGIESLLDIQDIASLAPGASIIDYMGTDLDKTTDTTWLDNYRAMVLDDRASVLSISYGGCEILNAASTLNAENYYSMEAAAQGQTILASSGDDGATGCFQNGGSTAKTASVNDPASQPFVTGVGGTTLSTGAAWSGSGGGTSSFWPISSTGFQSGFTGPGFNSTACKPKAGFTCRQVPDVAADADPYSGYPIYVNGGWDIIGGTSGATPTWAAMIAIANTRAACKANGPVGFLNNALYSAAKTAYATDYTDITTGDNIADGTGVGYQAAAGYDLPTGLGEPKAAALSSSLCGQLPVRATGAGTYHSVTPTRLLDTRKGATVPPNGITGIQVEGNAGIPASGVTSVVLNVTVTGTTGAGFLTAWGDGTPRPKTSNLNWAKGNTISNLVTVPVPGDGRVEFFTNSRTHVIADVEGYFTNDAGGATLTTKAPTRILDTRSATGIGTKTPITNGTVTVKVGGAHGIPATATSVVLNLTTVGTGASGSFTAWGSGSQPGTFNNTWSAVNSVHADLAVVPVDASGNVHIHVTGKSHVVADVFGYFTAASTGGKLTSAGPARLLDTRAALGVTTKTPLAARHTIALQITGRAGVPAGVKAVVLNVTVTGGTASGFLTAWADRAARPLTSNLNWIAGQTIPNQVVVPVGADGKVDLYVSSTTHVIADVFGYYL